MKSKYLKLVGFLVATVTVGFIMGVIMANITNKSGEKTSVAAESSGTGNKEDYSKEEANNKEEVKDNATINSQDKETTNSEEKEKDEIVVARPSNFEATEVTSTTVALAWSAPESTNGLIGYTLYKGGEKLAEIPADSKSYLVEGLSANSICAFKIESNYSNGEASKTTAVNVRTKK